MDLWQLSGLQSVNTPEPENAPSESSNNSLLLTDSGGSNSASDNLAKVHRAEWDDYIARFAPVEDQLFDKYNDDEGRAASVEKAGLTAGLAMASSKEQTDRDFSRYGLSLTDRQQSSRDKNHALEKVAAEAGAKNTMRAAKEEEQTGIITGGLSSTRSTAGA